MVTQWKKDRATKQLYGKMGYRRVFNFPKTALPRKLTLGENPRQMSKTSLKRLHTVFSLEEEKKLVFYLIEIGDLLFGLTTKDMYK